MLTSSFAETTMHTVRCALQHLRDHGNLPDRAEQHEAAFLTRLRGKKSKKRPREESLPAPTPTITTLL